MNYTEEPGLLLVVLSTSPLGLASKTTNLLTN